MYYTAMSLCLAAAILRLLCSGSGFNSFIGMPDWWWSISHNIYLHTFNHEILQKCVARGYMSPPLSVSRLGIMGTRPAYVNILSSQGNPPTSPIINACQDLRKTAVVNFDLMYNFSFILPASSFHWYALFLRTFSFYESPWRLINAVVQYSVQNGRNQSWIIKDFVPL